MRLHEANAIAKIYERRAWLGCVGSGPLPEAGTVKEIRNRGGADMWALVAPYYPCSWSLEKHPSIGKGNDAGKWTCGLREIGPRRSCVVYSFGSNNQFEFELAVSAFSECEIHTFDPTSNPPKSSVANKLKRSTFHRVGLGHRDGIFNLSKGAFPVRSIESLMRELGHWETGVDLLKIDVEGAEFSVVEKTDWGRMKVGQLLMEVHPGETLNRQSNVLRSKLRRNAFGSFIDDTERRNSREALGMCPDCLFTALHLNAFMLVLESAGLRLFSSEPVSSDGRKVEIGMINPMWHPRMGFNRSCDISTTRERSRDL